MALLFAMKKKKKKEEETFALQTFILQFSVAGNIQPDVINIRSLLSSFKQIPSKDQVHRQNYVQEHIYTHKDI